MADDARRAARRMARLEAIRRTTGVEPFTPEIAEHCANIFSELSEKGRLIPQKDRIITKLSQLTALPMGTNCE